MTDEILLKSRRDLRERAVALMALRNAPCNIFRSLVALLCLLLPRLRNFKRIIKEADLPAFLMNLVTESPPQPVIN